MNIFNLFGDSLANAVCQNNPLRDELWQMHAWGLQIWTNIKLLVLVCGCWPFCTLYDPHLENLFHCEGNQDTAMLLGTCQTGSSLRPHHLLWRHSLGPHQDAAMGMTSKLLPWPCLSHAGLYLVYCNLGYLPPHSTDLPQVVYCWCIPLCDT